MPALPVGDDGVELDQRDTHAEDGLIGGPDGRRWLLRFRNVAQKQGKATRESQPSHVPYLQRGKNLEYTAIRRYRAPQGRVEISPANWLWQVVVHTCLEAALAV